MMIYSFALGNTRASLERMIGGAISYLLQYQMILRSSINARVSSLSSVLNNVILNRGQFCIGRKDMTDRLQ